MQTIFSLWGGVLTLTNEGGQLALNINGDVALGGGSAAGFIGAKGSGSIYLNEQKDFDLLMGALESHSPSFLVPIEQTAQAAGDAEIPKL